jgi:Ca2+-transporting ATPase
LLGLRAQDGSLLLPFTALQILWINFLGDGPPALAIALDSHQDVLRDPPRAVRAPLLDGAAARFVGIDGFLKGGVGLVLLIALPNLGASSEATAVFLYEGVAKLLSVFPARRLAGSLKPNTWIWAAAAVSVALQLACVSVKPLRNMLALTPLSVVHLAVVATALLGTMTLGELFLLVLRRSRAEPIARRAA